MKIAIAVPELTQPDENLETVLRLLNEACQNGAELVLFPESTLTGLDIKGYYHKDLRLAHKLTSAPIQALLTATKQHSVWLCFGFIELDTNPERTMYDTALLVNPDGQICQHYRRISPHWHYSENIPIEYGQGKQVFVSQTPLGRTGIIICGDLFYDKTVALAQSLQLDTLLFPLYRTMEGNFPADETQAMWEAEFVDYAEQVKQIGATTLLANSIDLDGDYDGASFGSAWVISPDGQLLASLPVYQEGILYYDLPEK